MFIVVSVYFPGFPNPAPSAEPGEAPGSDPSKYSRDTALREDIGHHEILGQARRMPYRRDVEAAADLQILRHMRQMRRHQQDVGDAFRAFALEIIQNTL